MNDVQPNAVAVRAPAGALAWSVSRGFIFNVDELDDSHDEGEMTLLITNRRQRRETGVVDGIEGDAPLAALIRIDRQLIDLARYVEDVHIRLGDIGEAIVAVAARPRQIADDTTDPW